jgi:hypothetical protein
LGTKEKRKKNGIKARSIGNIIGEQSVNLREHVGNKGKKKKLLLLPLSQNFYKKKKQGTLSAC